MTERRIPQSQDFHQKPTFADKKNADTNYQSAKDVMDAARKFYTETNPYSDQVTIQFPTDRPITVYGIGDVHMGSIFSDVKRFERDMDVIADTPGAYMVIPSNLIDAFIPAHHPSGMQDNAITAYQQANAMNQIIRKYDDMGKILGMVRSPCHEGWIENATSVDIQDAIFMGTNVPRLNNGGIVHMEFPNGAEFNLALYHQFGRGNGSEQNKNAATWDRLKNAKNGKVDAIMAAHSHVAEAEHAYFGENPKRKEVVLLRTGSYKGNVSGEKDAPDDRFQKDFSGRDGEPGGQAITFLPRVGQMRTHFNPLRAAEYQDKLNRFAILEETGRLNDIWEATKTKKPTQ